MAVGGYASPNLRFIETTTAQSKTTGARTSPAKRIAVAVSTTLHVHVFADLVSRRIPRVSICVPTVRDRHVVTDALRRVHIS